MKEKITTREKINFISKEIIPTLFVRKAKFYTVFNSIAGSMHPILSVLVLRYILDMIKDKSVTTEKIVLIGFIYAFFYALFSITNNMLTHYFHADIVKKRMGMLHDTALKITKMDYDQFENPEFMLNVQKAFAGIGGDNGGYQQVCMTIFSMIPQIIIAIVFSIILIRESIFIVLAVIVGLIVSFFISVKVSNFEYKKRDKEVDYNRKINVYNAVTTDFTYGKDIRIFDLSQTLYNNIDRLIKKLVSFSFKKSMYSFKLSFVDNLFIYISDFISYGILAYLAFIGRISIAEVVMLMSMVLMFSNTVHAIGQNVGDILKYTPFVIDTFEFNDSDFNLNKSTRFVEFEGPVDIEFRNVSYKYPGAEKFVFKDLNFRIERGKKVAIIGVNGAGKTTIVKLMTGLSKPHSGSILINDIDINDLSDESKFRIFSAVFQESQPLAFTIAENIAVDDEDIDFDKVEYVLKKVGLWEKVSSLENSYNSNMLKVLYDDGVILSGGENQKLMIARALYKDYASVMIMDEPTSALDAFAEQKIYQEFDSYMGEKTGIFISHRLASTKFCDEILFLDGGQIIAKGPHDVLIDRCDKYRKMYETQGKYYKGEEDA